MVRLLVAVLFASPGLASAQDPLQILKDTAAVYSQLERFHFEWEGVSEREGEMLYSREKSRYVAAVSGPDRVRAEAHRSFGSNVTVADGGKVWHFAPAWGKYAVSPVESPVFAKKLIPEWRRHPAISLIHSYLYYEMPRIPNEVKSAELLPAEEITVVGQRIPCYVVRVRYAPHRNRRPFTNEVVTYWIDKKRLLVLKEKLQATGPLRAQQPNDIYEFRHERRLTVAEINAAPPARLFVFEPPAEAVEVSEITSDAYQPDLTGRPAPKLTATALDGSEVNLAAMRVRPVLLHFWATWCAPCRRQMAELRDLYRRAGERVSMVGVSVDAEEETARGYVTENDYGWTMVHDSRGQIARAFRVNSYPVVLVIDTSGKVVAQSFGSGPSATMQIMEGLAKAGIALD